MNDNENKILIQKISKLIQEIKEIILKSIAEKRTNKQKSN